MKCLSVLTVFLLMLSCSLNDVADVTEQPPVNILTEEDVRINNEEEIAEFININNLEAQKTDTGLYYIITEEGTGDQPTPTDDVTVGYRGYFTNGDVFDQGTESGLEINLQDVIEGWTEGIPLFKEGGRGMLLIPSHLGYGLNGFSTIPGGAVLIFDIHLIAVN